MFWWKFAKFFMSFFQTTSQSFFKFCMTLLSWNILLCTFLGQTRYTLHKRDQSKCKIFRLFGAQIKIHQILIIFETKNNCTTLIVRIGVSTPSKTPPRHSCQGSPYIDKPSKPPFRLSPPLYIVFCECPPPLKSDLSVNPQNITVFHP